MAKNIAAKRGAKEARRKAVVAAKRKLELRSHSKAGRIQIGAQLPIAHCVVSDGLFENGMGRITLVRGVAPGTMYFASFLLDTFCLGVKDVVNRALESEAVHALLNTLASADADSPIAPSEARKLLRDLAAWAEGNGFAQAEDYRMAEALFGSVTPADTDYRPRFGRDGKIFYVPGPSESEALVRRRSLDISERFGEEAVAIGNGMTLADVKAIFEQASEELETSSGDEDLEDDDMVIEGHAEEPEAEPPPVA